MNLPDNTNARNVRSVNSIFSKVFYSAGHGRRMMWFYAGLREKVPRNVAELRNVTNITNLSKLNVESGVTFRGFDKLSNFLSKLQKLYPPDTVVFSGMYLMFNNNNMIFLHFRS